MATIPESKITESRSPVVFFVRCRRTYDLKNKSVNFFLPVYLTYHEDRIPVIVSEKA